MKKGNSILLLSLVVFCTIIVIVIAYGIINLALTKGINDSQEEEFDSLADIDKFNLTNFKYELEESTFLGGYRLNGATARVTLENNILTVSIISNSLEYVNEMTLNGNVLKANWYNIKDLDKITLGIMDIAYSMSHSEKDAISKYIASTDINLLNLKSVGIEVADDSISIRINGNINFIDVSNQYITLEDASKVKNELEKEGIVKLGNENVMAIKTGYNDEIVISVAQYGKLTKLAYESLFNILGFTLNYNETYENFLNSHLNYRFKNEENDEYRIEINPKKETYEENTFGNMEMIRMTIFK